MLFRSLLWWGARPELPAPPSPINDPGVHPLFQEAYDLNKTKLGNRTSDPTPNDALHEAAHERAMVLWSLKLSRFWKLPPNTRQQWESDHDASWNDQRNQDWFDPTRRTKIFRLLGLPKGKTPPYAGTASHWEKNPGQWRWIGGLTYYCNFIGDVTLFQQFERGIMIGPVRTSATAQRGEVVIIFNDLSWDSISIDPKKFSIPDCNEPSDIR